MLENIVKFTVTVTLLIVILAAFVMLILPWVGKLLAAMMSLF